MSEKVTVIGSIAVLGEANQVSDKFVKRDLVIETQDKYPQEILIEFTQDKCDMLNTYKVGDNVEVSVNIRGRKWTNPDGVDKYFNSLVGWKIEKSGTSQEPQGNQAPQGTQSPQDSAGTDEDDELPF